MKMTTQITLIALLMPIAVSVSQVKPTKVIFFGDSITELGIKPGGYITMMKDALATEASSNRFDLIGSGISGNKVYDLFLRLEDDVLSKAPDIVVIYIGVNDVWHKTLLGTGTDADKFEKFYIAIIRRLQERKVKLVLCTPAVIGEKTDNSNQQDGDLNQYSHIIRSLAAKFRGTLCDLRKAFLEYNLRYNTGNAASGILTTDRVHLNEKGNKLVADLLLAKLSGM